MAGGSLSDLSFGLSLDDKASRQLNSVKRLLDDISASATSLQEKHSGLGFDHIRVDGIEAVNAAIKALTRDMSTAGSAAEAIEKIIKRINENQAKISGFTVPTTDGLSTLKDTDKTAKSLYDDLGRLESSFRDLRSVMTMTAGQGDTMSIYSQNAAKMILRLEDVKQKLREVTELYNQGFGKGLAVNALNSSAGRLKGARESIVSMLADPSLLSNQTKVKQVLDETAVAAKKADAAIRDYKSQTSDQGALERNLERAKQRYLELSEVIRQMKSVSYEGKQYGLDTTRLDAQIERSVSGVTRLRELLQALHSERYDVSTKVSMGDGRDISGATKISIRNARDLTKETQTNIDLLNKQRQAEEKAAAKVRGDLANSFHQANQHASQLSGTMDSIRQKAGALSGTKIGINDGQLRSAAKLAMDSSQSLKKLEEDITRAEARMKELADWMNKIMASNPDKSGQTETLRQLQNEYYGLKTYVEQLYSQLSNAGNGMQAFANSLVKGSTSAKEHEQRQRELTNAFEKYFHVQEQSTAAEQRNAAAIARNNAARQESVAAIRRQAEALVQSRVAALEGQQRQIAELYKNGKGVMSTEEIDRIRNAYAAVSRELMELRSVMQNVHSYSTKQLFSFGRGTSNLSPLIGSMQASLQKTLEVGRAAARVQSDLAKAFRQANQSANQMSGTLQDLKSLFLQGGLVYGAQQFVMSIIQVGGEMERQHIALQSILGDVQNANTIYGQIQELALRSPFTFSELNKDVKQLAAYGVKYEDLYDTTKRLADMSAGLGVSFERIALAFGQVQARGWLDGKELRQIAYAGIPLLSKLSELYSEREGKKVSTSEIKKRISNREVGFEDVKQIFWDMTDVGGEFYNMQDVLSQTLLGRWLKLKDAWEIMLSDFASGKSIVGSTLSFIIDRVTDLVQSMHTLAPVVTAAFSGFALNKAFTALGGGVAAGFITNKANIADGYSRRLMQGERLSATEMRLLATKRQITNEDLKTLAASNAITKAEMQRLLVAGKITAQQYKTNVAMLSQQAVFPRLMVQMRQMFRANYWADFAARGSAAMSLIGKGVVGLGRGLFSALGGLPGILITGLAMAGAAIAGNLQKWKERISQTQDELKDRTKSIGEFLDKNATDGVIAYGDAKEIDALIESYKEKLKEIAPYKAMAYEMNAAEIQSHEERLRYLAHELDLQKEAAKLASEKLGITNTYKSFANSFERNKETAQNYADAYAATKQYSPSKVDYDNLAEWTKKYDEAVEGMRQKLEREVGDIKNSPRLQAVADQIFSSFFAEGKWDQSVADKFRADVLIAMGCDNDFYSKKFNENLRNAVEKNFPDIAAKIRNDVSLDEASKTKVKNMMRGAANQLKYDYHVPESELQRLLDASRFEATVHLAFAQEDISDLQRQLVSQLNDYAFKKNYGEKTKDVESWSKNNVGMYAYKNRARAAIDDAYNEFLAMRAAFNNGKVTEAMKNGAEDAYNTMVEAYRETTGETYEGDKKKSNKDKNKNKGDQELKVWQERLQAAKTFYSEYKKYRDVIGTDRALKEVEELFPDVKDMDVKDYVGSLQKILDQLGDGWFNKSTERKRFKTQIVQAIKDWNLEEVFKREADEISSAFTEELEKGIAQFDLYKSLFEKTGSDAFASQAFKDGAIWDASTKDLARQFKEKTGEDVDLDATDEQAKHHLENIEGAYDLWKKIVDLVKDGYKKSLEESAEVWSKYATIAEKLASINGKYNRIVAEARQRNDASSAETIRRAERGRRNETTDAIYNGFEELKPIAEQLNDIADKYAELIKYARQTGDGTLLRKAEGSRAAAVNDVLWKDFNKQTGIEGTAANIENIGHDAVKALSEVIEKWLGKQNLSSELADKLVGFQQKVKDYEVKRGNIIAGIRGLSQGNAISSYLNGNLGERTTRVGADGTTRYVLNSHQAKKMGLTEGGVGYTQGELEEGATDGKNAFSESLNALSTKFKALQDCLDPVIQLFETLGMEDTPIGVAASTASNALGAASQVAGGLNALGLSSMGPYGAAAAAALSVTSSLLALHDKQLQKEIDASKERQKVEEYLYENIKSTIDDLLGGVYSFSLDGDMRKQLEDIIKVGSFRVSGDSNTAKWLNEALGSIYKEDTIKAAQRALSENNNAYQGELAALMAQRDEIEHQYELEAKKKDSDSTALIEYKQQLTEAEQAVEEFATSFAEEIYGIDIKSWASELTDAIIEAWATGEDAADAYADKVKDIMKSLAKTILSQMFMEKALEPVKEYYTEELQENGKLTEAAIYKIGDMVMSAGDDAIFNMTKMLEYWKDKGWDLSENSSSSTSKSIKSITEETADLLASYLNAIRLDVSVNRENVRLIAAAVTDLPSLNTIAQSQLTQLTTLVTLANARNSKMDDMYDWMRSVTSGTKKIYVS